MSNMLRGLGILGGCSTSGRSSRQTPLAAVEKLEMDVVRRYIAVVLKDEPDLDASRVAVDQ